MGQETGPDASFSGARLAEAAKAYPGALAGFGCALAGTCGFLLIALRRNRTPDTHRGDDEPW